MKDMSDLIVDWYDEMISLNEERENYEACSFYKASKESFLKFKDEGSVLYKGKRYSPEEIMELVKKEKEMKGLKGTLN